MKSNPKSIAGSVQLGLFTEVWVDFRVGGLVAVFKSGLESKTLEFMKLSKQKNLQGDSQLLSKCKILYEYALSSFAKLECRGILSFRADFYTIESRASVISGSIQDLSNKITF